MCSAVNVKFLILKQINIYSLKIIYIYDSDNLYPSHKNES